LFFVLPAATAQAALPTPKKTELKFGSSFGGVKLGTKADSAIKTWGKGSSCEGAQGPIVQATCTWEGSASTGQASLDIREGKVFGISLDAGQKSSGECVYKGALVKWKDSKGIGLGSNMSTVAKKYKKGFANGGGWQLNSGKRATLWDSSGGRACRISLTYLSAL
jgi:hypothetical protein